MQTPQYKRILLKISGEALAGDKHFGLDFDVIGNVCNVVKQCVDMGVQVGIVIGGGNFWRGVRNGTGKMERTRADHMGMLATVMNCIYVSEIFRSTGMETEILTPFAVGAMTILTSVMQFAMLPLQGLGQGAQPIISYNYGAKLTGRVRSAYKLLLALSLSYASLLWLGVMLAPQAFAAMFTSDPALIDFTKHALRIYMA